MPKPMQMIGPRPLIRRVMRFLRPTSANNIELTGDHATFVAKKNFVMCLGYGAAHIKNYFLT